MERIVACPNGTSLAIDEIGPGDGPLLLQLEGHMAQLVATPRSYCERLAGLGYRVVRVDNRDAGRSTRFPGAGYTLADMAEDVHGLLQVLGSPAVVCGRSMGGAIAQLLALAHPEDVLGLGLFFTYAKQVPAGLLPPPRPAPFGDAESYRRWEHASLRPIAGPDYPFAPEYIDELAATAWARAGAVDWDGYERQRRAMWLTPPWASRLAQVSVPVAIVHGEQDSVITLPAARALQRALPQAVLRVVPGMGHQQPPELDELFVAATLHAADQGGELAENAPHTH